MEIYRQAVGDRFRLFGFRNDFMQQGEFFAVDILQTICFYKKINDWVHANTTWKTYYHTCGSVVNLLDDFVEMGMDIINPLQFSAKGMDPVVIKQKYGDKLFWGGGVDTQKVLSFGTAQEVEDQVKERLQQLSPGGGYVFNTIHNVVGNVPAQNLLAMFNAYREFCGLKLLKSDADSSACIPARGWAGFIRGSFVC
ncbi:MAG: uroporphyrinogen decarboxylase family protein [Eisenbergiella sp.]